MTTKRNTWIQTHTGVAFDLLDPKPADVRTADLAHAQAWLMRFTGHAGGYSVAAHATYVGRLLALRYPDEPELALAGHLHDAHEVYVGDVSSPMKVAFRELGGGDAYRILDRGAQAAVFRRYGVDPELGHDPRLVEADLALLHLERDRYLGLEAAPWNLPAARPGAVEAKAIGWAGWEITSFGDAAAGRWRIELEGRLDRCGRAGCADER